MSLVLADRNHWNPELQQRLAQQQLHLLTPFKISQARERAMAKGTDPYAVLH